ncbi:MAG TPA: filamentous hemagglutinin N-terminal domain-containing protein [Leptolyngbyaceae cyanobacterium]
MIQSWKLGLASWLVMSGAIASLSFANAFWVNCAYAQITADTTLGIENSTLTSTGLVDAINGGATRGANLFHSFQEFNVNEGRTAVFTNPTGIENILTRVTGDNPSNILGTLGVSGGNANLFLINPKGIIFGKNARLDVKGSFVASTASSLNFADGTKFSATAPQTTPLLTVSVPIGLQFGAGAGRIINQSVVDNIDGIPVGLQVDPENTLALVGGDVALEGGNLTAEAGRIELGGVASSSLVSLTPTDQGFALGYEGVQNFRDIQLSQAAYLEASGDGGGNIQVQGKRVTLTDGSGIAAVTAESRSGGTLTVNASDSVELIGSADNQSFSSLNTDTFGSGTAGSISITTKRLIANGAYISATTSDSGQGGNLTVNAFDSVELSKAVETPDGQVTSGLFTGTSSAGDAGNVRITTRKLTVKNGAVVTAGTNIGSQGNGGNLTVNASDSIELSGTAPNPENTSGLFARTRGTGAAGNLTITTGQLIVRDQAQVTVSGVETGNAGHLELRASNIRLDNQGAILADTAFGEGGNIRLQAQDILLLRGNSNISTTAGNQGGFGNGGNITIDAGTLIGLENSDITANAFEGEGGLIQITAQGILGLEVREQRSHNSSDITAFSQQNPELSGEVEIDTLNADLSRGIVSLPTVQTDTQVVQACQPGGSQASSEFVVTGRGGLPPSPTEALSSDSIQIDWVTLNPEPEDRYSLDVSQNTTTPESIFIVEAQGWVFGNNGEVMLTASAPTASFHIPWMTVVDCYAPKTS